MMKKVIIMMGLCLVYMAGIHAGWQEAIKHDLRYGVAQRDASGNLRIVNICTMDVKDCTIGRVTVAPWTWIGAGLEDIEYQMSPIVRLSIQEPGKKQPTIINSGETKVLTGEGDQVNLIAYYGNLPVKFRAPVKNTPGPIVFPKDFEMVQ